MKESTEPVLELGGSIPDSRCILMGITPNVSMNKVEWLREVTDEEYNEIVGKKWN